jgi:chloramphenicol O-acetyltransferase
VKFIQLIGTHGAGHHFYYFTKMFTTGYSFTVEMDITNTYHTVERAGKKFFRVFVSGIPSDFPAAGISHCRTE